MNVNYTMFYNCLCTMSGGAIYFTSPNACLRMICANRGSGGAESCGHFSFLSVNQVNQEEYLSVSYCSHTTTGYYSIYLHSGSQRVDNTNISMNNAYRSSAIYTYSPSSFISSHCTVANNKASESRCIWFYSTTGSISMSYANIVHNNSPSGFGIVYVHGAGLKILMYSIFQNNQNYLFCVWTGSLEVSHSFISHLGVFSTSLAVSTATNNSFTIIITYQIQFFISYHCDPENLVQTPYQSQDHV